MLPFDIELCTPFGGSDLGRISGSNPELNLNIQGKLEGALRRSRLVLWMVASKCNVFLEAIPKEKRVAIESGSILAVIPRV